MDRKKIERFINSSPLAKKIQLQGKIVLHRCSLSPKQIAAIQGRQSCEFTGQPLYELEVGGTVIARGEIIEKEDEYFFVPEKKNDNEETDQ